MGPSSGTIWPGRSAPRWPALFALGWVRRTQRRRVVQVTDDGRDQLHQVLGLPADWAQPAAGDAWPGRRAAS